MFFRRFFTKRDEERKQRMIESERQQKVETAKRDDCTVRRFSIDFQLQNLHVRRRPPVFLRPSVSCIITWLVSERGSDRPSLAGDGHES